MRLVMNTVLPERLSPVTASHTVASPASSPRLPVSRSDACANNGGSQLRFTGVIRLIGSRGQPIPPACECGSPLARGRRHTKGSGPKTALLQVAVAVDEAFELLGCGLDYVRTRRHSCFTAEVHVRYLRELHAGDPVRVTFQLLDYDQKRMHYF